MKYGKNTIVFYMNGSFYEVLEINYPESIGYA